MKIACSLLLGSVCLLPAAVTAQAQTPGCGDSSTLKDFYSPADTERAEQFLRSLQAAVQAGDRSKVASMVQYPLRVNGGNGRHSQIRSPQQFRAQYDRLFSADTMQAIRNQIPKCMFARDQGVMIGNGQVWFQDDGKGTFRIWSLNLAN